MKLTVSINMEHEGERRSGMMVPGNMIFTLRFKKHSKRMGEIV